MPKLLPLLHPGEILLEEFLKPRRMAPNRLALNLRVPANRIQAIVKGERDISVDTAMRLGRFFGTSTEFWLNAQMSYDVRKAKREIGAQIERDVTPVELACA